MNLPFSGVFDQDEVFSLLRRSDAASDADLAIALGRERRGLDDFLSLISPRAADRLESLAAKSRETALRRFGRVVQLYIPLYLSSECEGSCLYCGFRKDLVIERETLGLDRVVEEAARIRAMGFGHILLVSGTAPSTVTMDYLTSVISALSRDFSSIALEIFALTADQYARLRTAGADGVTLYQESYHRETYERVHPGGSKRDYTWRLDAPDRVCEAGFRKVNIGSLLGLYDWRFEAVSLALHSRYLMKRRWQTQLSVSFPRITDHPADFSFTPVSDRSLVQMAVAFRLCFPDTNLVISTRESPALRMNLVKLGVTQMSAGSRTSPGGYAADANTRDGQFRVRDERPAEEIAAELRRMGYEPVWKDWEIGMS